MMRTRPLPYLFLISGTRETSIQPVNSLGFRFACSGPIMSNVRAIGQVQYGRLARALYCLDAVAHLQEGPVHEHGNPSGRSDAAGSRPAGARLAARTGNVCR